MHATAQVRFGFYADTQGLAPRTSSVDNGDMAGQKTADRVLDWLTAAGVFGCVALALTALIGFERPNTALLILASALILVVPFGMLVHLTMTSGLSREEKRLWLREFGSRRIATGLADYLTCRDRQATIRRRVDRAASRQFTSGAPPDAP